MFGDAVNDGMLESNPFANLCLSTGRGRKDITAITEKQLNHLADTATSEAIELGRFGAQYPAMVLFAGYVGLRPGELYALRAEDIEASSAISAAACQSRRTRSARPRRARHARSRSRPPRKTRCSKCRATPPGCRSAPRRAGYGLSPPITVTSSSCARSRASPALTGTSCATQPRPCC
jgi:hypothetical protein